MTKRMSVVLPRRNTRSNLLSFTGQMTVEFVVCFPVLLVVALIAVNSILFFSECASFDRDFRNSVCAYASSPGHNQTVESSCEKIRESVVSNCLKEGIDITVTSSGVEGGLVEFSGELAFSPTLFGMGNLTSVFGVQFPKLTHSKHLVVDVYKPGVVL